MAKHKTSLATRILWGLVIGIVALVLLMVVVSFFTPAPTAEQKEAITFTEDYRKQIAQSWGIWDIVGTLGVLFLCGCFYWYFF